MAEAEKAVAPFRATLNRAASWGVPAHITVLYPFLPPNQVDDEVIAALRSLVAEVARFDAVLTHVDWFGDMVAWLAPHPDRPFRDLTEAVWRRFPEAPPYEGAHTEVVPHLTIGHDAPRAVLEHAAAAVSAHLPIAVAVDMVRLITGTPDQRPWRTVCEFPLGGCSTVRIADLMARMGHGSTRAAMIYQHASREQDRLIADALSAHITKERDRARNGHGRKKKHPA